MHVYNMKTYIYFDFKTNLHIHVELVLTTIILPLVFTYRTEKKRGFVYKSLANP